MSAAMLVRSSLGCAIWSVPSPPRALMSWLPLASSPDTSLPCIMCHASDTLALSSCGHGCPSCSVTQRSSVLVVSLALGGKC